MINVINNVAESTYKEIEIENDFFILKLQNNSNEIQQVNKNIGNDFIQLHYCLKGKSKFNFNEGRYGFDVSEEQSLLLYNPQQELPINLELQPKTSVVSILLSIKRFHSLFSQEADYIHFLNNDNKDKKYYDNKQTSPTIAVVLNQIMNFNIHRSIEKLYLKAKSYELLSLYFNHSEDADIEQCPFLVDEQNVVKIKNAKEIIIARMIEPPTLQELANEVGLTLKKIERRF